jgi:hypothetical protein
MNTEKRISKDNYVRPKHTIQDKLTQEEIDDKLEDYIEIEPAKLSKVPIGTHIRYFIKMADKHGIIKKVFRLGGQLKNKDNCDKYIILSNGKITWTVQVENAILYKKMSIEEIKEEYDNIVTDLESQISILKKDNKKLLKKLLDYEKN